MDSYQVTIMEYVDETSSPTQTPLHQHLLQCIYIMY